MSNSLDRIHPMAIAWLDLTHESGQRRLRNHGMIEKTTDRQLLPTFDVFSTLLSARLQQEGPRIAPVNQTQIPRVGARKAQGQPMCQDGHLEAPFVLIRVN